MDQQQLHDDFKLLCKRVELLEQTIETLRTKDNHQPSKNLLIRLDAIDVALKEQFNAVQSFMIAHSVPPQPTIEHQSTIHHHTPDIQQHQHSHHTTPTISKTIDVTSPSPPVTNISKVDATTQTHAATAPPPHTLPTPPPVKVRQTEKPKPSLLRQSSTASDKTHSAASTPLSARRPIDTMTINTDNKQNTDDAATLRQRKVAFAEHTQKKKASAQSLAIEAAKREVARAAARAAQKAKEEKERSSGSISWLIHIVMILLGVGALFLGIIAVVAYKARETGRIIR